MDLKLNNPVPSKTLPGGLTPNHISNPPGRGISTSKLKSNPGWLMGVNIASNFATDPIQKANLQATNSVVQPNSIKTAYEHYSRMFNQMRIKSIPDSIKKALKY